MSAEGTKEVDDRSKERHLGRYRIIRPLGKGGMGEVFLAEAHGSAGFTKLLALKVLGREMTGDEGRIRSLLREAFIGVALDHQNIVQILDFGEDGGAYYIAMEYVRGCSLHDLIGWTGRRKDPFPVRFAVHIARTVADTLHYIHNLTTLRGEKLGLIHGDVTPSNILLSSDGRIKLADFGIAALARELERAESVAGKPEYLPPEAFSGAEPDASFDVYALAAVLYGTIAGRTWDEAPDDDPEERKSDEVASAGRRLFSAPLDSLNSGCPRALAGVVARALSKRPDLRYPTAMSFRAALDDAFPRSLDDAERYADFAAKRCLQKEAGPSDAALLTRDAFSTTELEPHITASDLPSTKVQRTIPALRFGMSPALSSEVARDYGERLSGLLSRLMGRPVRTIVFADYATSMECLIVGEVDFAWMPPEPFINVADRGGGILVVAKRRGRTQYEAVIAVQAGSPINELDGLLGKSMAWVDKESSSGYLFAAAEIIRKLGPPDEVFKRQHFHGSHRAVCEAVANGWADAGATYAVRDRDGTLVYSGWLDLMRDRAGELRPLVFAGPIPSDTIAHRPGLPIRLRDRLIQVLSALHESEEGRLIIDQVFGAQQLMPAEIDTYEAVRQVMMTVKGQGEKG